MEYESLPVTNITTHMMAGGLAGVVEHGVVYPIDTIKTRMQTLNASSGLSMTETIRNIVKMEGIARPMKGVTTVLLGAGPAHALYFASYESSKVFLGHFTRKSHEHIITGLSGCIASMVHDAVSNPIEVIKQRIQMQDSKYKSIFDCVTCVYRKEGWKAFYKSYRVQVLMNLPFQFAYFVIYESTQNIINKERKYNPASHILCGAAAGGIAAAFTTPLDVLKTSLNIQSPPTKNVMHAVKTIYNFGGFAGFYYGIGARVLYHMPGAAICWFTYETLKNFIKSPVGN